MRHIAAMALAALIGLPTLEAAGQKVAHPFVCTDNGRNRVYVVAATGEIEWEYPARVCQDAWMLPNGNILLSHIHGVKEVTRDKQVVWEYKTQRPNEVHTCQPLPDGRVLIGECGTCRLIEVDRQGKVQKEIKLTTTTRNIHLQMRQCRRTPQGTYLVTFTGENKVCEFDADGKLSRTIKVPRKHVFAAVRLPDGNTLIACGDAHTLIEVDRNDKVVWRIDENELPGNPLRFVAGVQRLPNGNTVVCNWGGHGHRGKQPQVFEVTRDKKVVWQVFDNKQFRLFSSIHLLDVPGDPTKGEILR